MSPRIAGSLTLFGMAFLEWFSPGWTGAFSEPIDLSPGQSRIIFSVFVTGAMVLLFMKD